MDLANRRVTRGDATLELTSKEFELLKYLLEHKEHVVTRDALARDLWKEVERGPSLNNLIDVHIANLRSKIDSDQPQEFVQTVRGVGFILRLNKG